jgi:hypothetical protein
MALPLAVAALTLALVGIPSAPTSDPSNPPPDTSVNSGKLTFDVSATDHVGLEPATPSAHGGEGVAAPADQPALPPCGQGDSVGDCEPTTTCEANSVSPTGWITVIAYGYSIVNSDFMLGPPCRPGQTANGPNLPALVLRAFQSIPLPEPHLDIQPPRGKTLIGLETILSTHAGPFTRNLTLLGRSVELRIHASSYAWIHGDGTTQTTDWAGRPWERGLPIDRYITHIYEDTGRFAPSVRVTWSADYRVGNGPWLPVNGAVHRTSPPTDLQVLEAEPKLVAP